MRGNFCNLAKVYRHIQLQAILCNLVQQDIILAQTLFSILAVSTCLGLLIRFGDDANLTLVGDLGIVVVEGVAILIVLNGAMVAVHLESKTTLVKMQCLESNGLTGWDRKWARRFWKSCDQIKIKFGGHNFLEKQTPLKCLDG